MQQQPPKAPVGVGKHKEVAGKGTVPLAFLVYILTESHLISLPGWLGRKEQRESVSTHSPLHTHILLGKTSVSRMSLVLSLIAD